MSDEYTNDPTLSAMAKSMTPEERAACAADIAEEVARLGRLRASLLEGTPVEGVQVPESEKKILPFPEEAVGMTPENILRSALGDVDKVRALVMVYMHEDKGPILGFSSRISFFDWAVADSLVGACAATAATTVINGTGGGGGRRKRA